MSSTDDQINQNAAFLIDGYRNTASNTYYYNALATAFDFFGGVHPIELLHGMVHAHHRTSLPAKVSPGARTTTNRGRRTTAHR